MQLTDCLIEFPEVPQQRLIEALLEAFTAAEIVEMTLAVGLFLSMSKVLITLGLEPDTMPVTVLPTPGSQTNV